jgi:hypothetical protein
MWNVIGKNIALRNCLNPNTYWNTKNNELVCFVGEENKLKFLEKQIVRLKLYENYEIRLQWRILIKE